MNFDILFRNLLGALAALPWTKKSDIFRNIWGIMKFRKRVSLNKRLNDAWQILEGFDALEKDGIGTKALYKLREDIFDPDIVNSALLFFYQELESGYEFRRDFKETLQIEGELNQAIKENKALFQRNNHIEDSLPYSMIFYELCNEDEDDEMRIDGDSYDNIVNISHFYDEEYYYEKIKCQNINYIGSTKDMCNEITFVSNDYPNHQIYNNDINNDNIIINNNNNINNNNFLNSIN